MLASSILIALAVPVLLTSFGLGCLASELLHDYVEVGKYLYRKGCESRLEKQNRARFLLMPYVSWSDTVAHTHTPTHTDL
jgi:hypothetical protein